MTNENVSLDGSLDEIVFEHRNKEYGAYDLRSHYRSMLTKAFLIGTAIFVLGVVVPFLYNKIQAMNKETTEVKAELVNILEEEKPKEEIHEDLPPPPPPPKDEQKVEIIQNVVPEPVKAPKVQTPPPPIKVQMESQTGLVNQEGVKQTTYTPPPVQGPPSKSTAVESKPAPSTTEIYDTVDQSSEFPGGIGAFRTKVGESFDTSAMEGGEGTLKAEITFVVERDGSITDVKANGSNSDFNAEAVRTIKSIKNKWTPAKVNGQPVRSRYRLPLTMNFE